MIVLRCGVGTPSPTRVRRRRSLSRLSGIAIIALLLLLWSCGGDDGGDAPVLSDTDLRSMVIITSEGLPWEFDLVGDEAISTADAAAELPDPQVWEERYNEWQRAGGHWAQFQSGQEGILSIETEVEYYRSSEGAQPAWEAIRDVILSDEWTDFLEEQGLSSVRIEEVDADKVGDESIAVRMDVRLEEQVSSTYVVLFYRGSVLASALVGVQGEAASIQDAAAIAELVDGRIQDVLDR